LSRRHAVLREVAALCGASDPGAVADAILAPPCEHYGEWDWDETEVCPQPCGKRHWWCRACSRPMRPQCAYLAQLEQLTDEELWLA